MSTQHDNIDALIREKVYENDEQAVTGEALQETLVGMNDGVYEDIDKVNESLAQLDSSKQRKLVSGTNIKTVGGQSLLGAGDISIETDLSYTGTVFHDGDVDMNDVEEITIGGVAYSDGYDFLTSDACKLGRVIAQVNPTEVEPEEGYAYHEVTRFIIKGIDSIDVVITLEKISSAEEISDEIQTAVSGKVDGDGISAITALSQSAYDALEDGAGYESETLYVIV